MRTEDRSSDDEGCGIGRLGFGDGRGWRINDMAELERMSVLLALRHRAGGIKDAERCKRTWVERGMGGVFGFWFVWEQV